MFRFLFCLLCHLPFLLLAATNDDLTLDTAKHKLDPEVIPNKVREDDLEQFKSSLSDKKELFYKVSSKLKKGYIIKNKVSTKPSKFNHKISEENNLEEISNSTTNTSVPFSWIRNKLSILDLSKKVTNMVDSSSKSMKDIVDSFSSTLWHMTMPAHIAL